MTLVPSLLQAIVQVDGEALVLHAGEKPYVVTPGGQVDLASRGLTLDAVNGIVSQLLPAEVLRALDEFGAAQYQLGPRADFPQEQFTVVVARGGDDVWAEIRRRRIADDDRVPDDIFGPAATAGTGPHGAAEAEPVDDAIGDEAFGSPRAPLAPAPMAQDDDLLLPDAEQLWGSGDTVELSVDVIDEERQPAETAEPFAQIEEIAPAANQERAESQALEAMLWPEAILPSTVPAADTHEASSSVPVDHPSEGAEAEAAELIPLAHEDVQQSEQPNGVSRRWRPCCRRPHKRWCRSRWSI